MRFVLLIAAVASLSGCTTTGSNPVADMTPQWMGGLPPDAPPRPGTPAYDAWQAGRAQEATRPKGKATAQ
jgi:hypothetical protein